MNGKDFFSISFPVNYWQSLIVIASFPINFLLINNSHSQFLRSGIMLMQPKLINVLYLMKQFNFGIYAILKIHKIFHINRWMDFGNLEQQWMHDFILNLTISLMIKMFYDW